MLPFALLGTELRYLFTSLRRRMARPAILQDRWPRCPRSQQIPNRRPAIASSHPYKQWRICFNAESRRSQNVEIVDYL